MPPKRKSDAPNGTPKQAETKDASSKSKPVHVPIDEGFAQPGPSNVCIDDDGSVLDANLNQTNIGKNANKFYLLQLIQSGTKFYVHARWGRVGEKGGTKLVGPVPSEEAFREFHKRFREKTGLKWADRGKEAKAGKYTFLERRYEGDGEDDGEAASKKQKKEKVKEESPPEPPPSSKLPVETQRLVELIFNPEHFRNALQNIGYNQEKLPLGELSKATLKKGFEHLQELAHLLDDTTRAGREHDLSHAAAIEAFSNRYYSTIPHITGRNPAPPISNDEILRREVEMLDTLTDMEVGNAIMASRNAAAASALALIDQQFAQLKLAATPLAPASAESAAVRALYANTSSHHHGATPPVQDVFRIERAGEAARFAPRPPAASDRRLLWHGSRTTNFGGILRNGLRISPPEAPPNGSMFGKGIYLADVSSKSLGYCAASASAGNGLLLLCEAELGRPMLELDAADYDAGTRAAREGRIAVRGRGEAVPAGWVDAGAVHEDLSGVLMPDAKKMLEVVDADDACLMFNEYICYDVAQVRLRYLLRFAS